MRFSTIIASAITAAVVVAAPVEKRAVTTTWTVEVVTEYTTVYPSAATTTTTSVSKPKAAAASPIAAIQQGGGVRQQHHSQSIVVAPLAPKPTPTTTTQDPVSVPETTQIPVPFITTTEAAPVFTAPVTIPGQCSDWQSGTPDFNVSPVSCGVPVIDTINKWRKLYGKSPLKWASNVADAAWKTVTHNRGGVIMEHPGLVPGVAYGEVISPGFWSTGSLNTQGDSPFEVALMGWMCEVSSDIQLQAHGPTGKNQCDISRNVALISGSANKNEPTGHHDIFLGDYETVGCAYMNNANGDGGWSQFAGQWACDFGHDS